MCIFAFEFLERKNGILPEPLCKGLLHLADMSGGVDLEDMNVPMVRLAKLLFGISLNIHILLFNL